jgi:recA bacterial DNA recombination protein
MSLGPSQQERQPAKELAGALARLEARWGSAAIRLGGVAAPRGGPLTEGALAPALLPLPEEAPRPDPLSPTGDEPVSTGFPALDAALGTSGLPRQVSAIIRGGASSGKTTLALRCIAEAQARGSIAAYVDLGRSFDPFEAVCRGVDLLWLVVLRPSDPREGLELAGALLAGRAVDLLVVDLPARPGRGIDALLRRLTAHARRVGARLLVLEPVDLASHVHGALAESVGVRLELDRRDWIRLGRDVIGQRTEVTVAKNRFGPPGRRVELEIRYADDSDPPATLRTEFPSMPPDRLVPRTIEHATPLPLLASSASPPRVRRARDGGGDRRYRAGRAGRAALGPGHGPGHEPGREPVGGAARPAAGRGP